MLGGTADVIPESYTPVTTWDSMCEKKRAKKLKSLGLDMCSNTVLKLFSQYKTLASHPRSQFKIQPG